MQSRLLEGIILGSGYTSEEIKELLLAKSPVLSGQVLARISQLAAQILQVDDRSVVKRSSRIEILKSLLNVRAVTEKCPELIRLKRQKNFFHNLDKALQDSRWVFAHEEERNAVHARLDEKLGVRALRHEIKLLVIFYESMLIQQKCFDDVLLVKQAIEKIASGNVRRPPSWPESWLWLSDREPLPLERAFLDALPTPWKNFEKAPLTAHSVQASIGLWHTLDDAAETLMDDLLNSDPEGKLSHAILISDNAQARLSLSSSMTRRGLEESDPRDPNYWKHQEDLWKALLPLELMISRFERKKVAEWILATQGKSEASKIWIQEMAERGIRHGLQSYQSGKLSDLSKRLKLIHDQWSGKKTLEDVKKTHLESLMGMKIDAYSFQAIHTIYDQMELETKLGLFPRPQAPLRIWYERIRDRIQDLTSKVPPLRSTSKIRVMRFHQSTLAQFDHVWILGVSPSDITVKSVGDYGFNGREREVLAQEWDVESVRKKSEARVAVFKDWLSRAKKSVHFYASELSWNGKERESLELLFPLLWEDASQYPEITQHGAHARWAQSYGSKQAEVPAEYKLDPLLERTAQISASALDRMSRCFFMYVGRDRWKLDDERSPEVDLWPEVRGQILHDAVGFVLRDRLSPTQAVQQAWDKTKLKGLVMSGHNKVAQMKRLSFIVEKFAQKEKEYQERAMTKIQSLDQDELVLQVGEVSIQGRPDRVDEHPDGLFVMDFKTSSALPNGHQMVDEGYRLQLPFYALALSAKYQKPLLGAQYIELTRTGTRTKGIFFDRYNGKTPGKLTNTRAKNSLFDQALTDVWSQSMSQIEVHVKQLREGRFTVAPKDEAECDRCSYIDLCAKRRLPPQGLTEDLEATTDF